MFHSILCSFFLFIYPINNQALNLNLNNFKLTFLFFYLLHSTFTIFDSIASDLNLIFTSQPNLVIGSWGHPFLQPSCHHQIVFAKLSLKIEYLPLCEHLIYDYKNANEQLINRAIESFNWERSFESKNVHDQVYLFNKLILNIFHNFIPNKIITYNDKDPPWFNVDIRQILNKKGCCHSS